MGKLEPMSAWAEPLFNKNGKDFYEQSEDFILKIVERKKKLVGERATSEKLAKVDATLGAAMSALLGLSVLSADYTKILSALYTIYEISENYPESDNLISCLQSTMIHYINQLKSIHEETKTHHHLAQGSIYGSIHLPKEAIADYQSDGISSLTTDGTYLYIYWCSGRGGMFKIGTGEGNSLAGKVYLHQKTELTGSVTWVYLKNKLYARRIDEALGVLTVLSPDNFAVEGNISLHCNDKNVLNNAASARFNKRYPLLTDGEYLYVVVMSIANKERKLKDKHMEEVDKLKSEEEEGKEKKDLEATPEQNKTNEISKKSEALFGKSPVMPDANGIIASADPNNTGGESLYKCIEALKEAKLCEFYLLEFDTDTEKYKNEEKALYKNNADVQELHQAFSSFFTHED
jgi:hypothetical protein